MKLLIPYFFLLLFSLQIYAEDRWITTAPYQELTADYLGFSKKIVGASNYCPIKLALCSAPKIGSALEFSLEKIFVLKPQIIWLSSHTPKKLSESLKKMGLKFKVAPHDRWSDVEETMRLMINEAGSGHHQKFDQWKAELKKYDSILKEKLKAPVKIVFSSSDSRHEAVVGVSNTFYHDMVDYLFGVPSSRDQKPRYETWGIETFYKEDSKTIFILAGNELPASLKKAMNGKKTLGLKGENLGVPGPHLLSLFSQLTQGLTP